MGFAPTHWVFQDTTIEGAHRLVLLALAWHANNDTWDAWPSTRELANLTRLSRPTIFRCIADLRDADLLDVTPGRGRGNPNRYHLNPKGSHHETLNGQERSHPDTLSDEKRSQKGLIHAEKRSHLVDQNSQEPRNHTNAPKRSQPDTLSKRSQPDTLSHPQPQEPTRCTTCNHLAYDCLCGRGPLRELPPGRAR